MCGPKSANATDHVKSSWTPQDLFAGYAEDTFDAALVSHDDLDVGFLIKTGARIDRPALDKDALHRVHRGQVLCLKDAVQTANHGAIEVAPEAVRAVRGHLDAAPCGSAPSQAVVRYLHPFDSGCSGQIEAQAKIEDSADYERLSDTDRFSVGSFPREIQTPARIGFPELYPRAQPVICVVAWEERSTA